MRRVEVTNRDDRFRDLALSFHHDFRLSGGSREAASRDPATGGIVHTAAAAPLLNAIGAGAGVPARRRSRASGAPRTRSSEFRFRSRPASRRWSRPGSPRRDRSRRRAGSNAEARRLGLPGLLSRSRRYWSLWTSAGIRDEGDLPEEARDVYAQSLHTLRLLQSPSGAFLSGLEAPSDCRLREAAIAADALGRAGYGAAARRYFEFAAASARDAGELCAVLDAEGAPAAAPDHVLRAADGIALHLWAAGRHFDRERDAEFMGPIYESSLAPAAERLATAADPALGLPISTDPWEERWGAHASVAAAVRGGLRAASRLAALFGETARARAWVTAADQIARAVGNALYDPERGRFLRSVIFERDGERGESGEAAERRLDLTLDAALLWLGLFDDLEPEDPRVKATADAVRETLWLRAARAGSRATKPTRPWHSALREILRRARAGFGARDALARAARNPRRAAAPRPRGGARAPALDLGARGRGRAPPRPARWGIHDRSVARRDVGVRHATVLDYGERSRLLARCDRCGEPAPARRAPRRRAVARVTSRCRR